MRINYKNYPVLKYLELDNIDDNFDNFWFNNDDDLLLIDFTKNVFAKNLNIFKNNITHYAYHLESKIYDAKSNIYKGLYKILQTENFKIQGTFIFSDFVYFCNIEVVNGYIGGSCIVSIKDTRLLVTFSNKKTGVSLVFADMCSRSKTEWKEEVPKVFLLVANLFLFQKYAQVEIKNIKPNTKHKIEKDNIFNETKLPITYIDSTWFTNLVISGAFGVRGHFRLQPKKDQNSEWTKELIWIKDFEKQGYHRQARILNERNKNE